MKNMTKKELIKLSKKYNLDLKMSMLKAEIIKAIQKAEAASKPKTKPKAKKSIVKVLNPKAKSAPVAVVSAPVKRRVFNPMLHRFEYK